VDSPYREPIQATVARLEKENKILREMLAAEQTRHAPRSSGQRYVLFATAFASMLLLAGWVQKVSTHASHTSPIESSTRNYADQAEGYQRDCDTGDWSACTDLGTSYWSGHGVAKDSARAATLYASACELGDARGCFYAANLYASGDGVATDRERAAQLYAKACAGGRVAACRRADRR
jgi:TPR repeat protein